MSDKSPKRVILYHKPKGEQSVPPKIENKPQKEPEIKKKAVIEWNSKYLYEWLDLHPMINLNGLCRDAGVDRSNFAKWKKAGTDLKPEVVAKLTEILKQYGYGK